MSCNIRKLLEPAYLTLKQLLLKPFIDIKLMCMRSFLRQFISCIGMADDACTRIIAQHAGKPGCSIFAAIGNDHHTCMNAVAHTNTAAMVKAYPTGAACCIDQCVQ